MNGNILIIEDLAELADVVTRYLVKEGFGVKTVSSAEEALSLLDAPLPFPPSGQADRQESSVTPRGNLLFAGKYNLILLDINLPGMDGFEFLGRLKKISDIPVLIMSARTSEEDQITGFGIGADEYITKPFSPRVLTARVCSMFKRMEGFRDKEAWRLFSFGPYLLDMDTRVLKKDNKPIELCAKEYALLAFLAENSGTAMSPEAIYKKVWSGIYGDLTTVAVHVQRLRKKMEDNPANPKWLITIRGKGYKLIRYSAAEVPHEN